MACDYVVLLIWFYESGVCGQALEDKVLDKNCPSVLSLEVSFFHMYTYKLALGTLKTWKGRIQTRDLNKAISKKQQGFEFLHNTSAPLSLYFLHSIELMLSDYFI